LPSLPQLKPAPALGRSKEGLPLTGDQWMDNKSELIDQPGVDAACRCPGAANEVDVFAGLPLEGGDLVERPNEGTCGIRP
jgi:hypothetical protein